MAEEPKSEKGVNAPGTNNVRSFTVNKHKFECRKRTFHDQIKIRTFAMGLAQMNGANVNQAAVLADANGLEFSIAKLAICLTDAPDHWKDPEGNIAPELLDFEVYSDEFAGVLMEVITFHNSFRGPN